MEENKCARGEVVEVETFPEMDQEGADFMEEPTRRRSKSSTREDDRSKEGNG